MYEKLKETLECCSNDKCTECLLHPYLYCFEMLAAEAEKYIAELEERIAIMQESMEAMEKRLKDPDRIKATRCKDCRYFEPSNAEEGDNSGHCRNDYAPCQNQTVDAWWYCGSAEKG